jgi:hypothetical protein
MITEDPRVLAQVASERGNYVYVLVDPRDSTPFYIGKGVGTRMLQHGIDAAQLTADEAEDEGSRKLQRIREMRGEGLRTVSNRCPGHKLRELRGRACQLGPAVTRVTQVIPAATIRLRGWCQPASRTFDSGNRAQGRQA